MTAHSNGSDGVPSRSSPSEVCYDAFLLHGGLIGKPLCQRSLNRASRDPRTSVLGYPVA